MTEVQAYETRIKAASDFKFCHFGAEIPTEKELDLMTPGTSQAIGNTHGKSTFLLNQFRTKEKRGGLIGIFREAAGRFCVVFEMKRYGSYKTAVEAATAFNVLARQKYHENAVLCDLVAAEIYGTRP